MCLVANVNDLVGLWHRRLGHASYGVISKLARSDLVIGLPKSSYSKAQVCSACAHGKMTRTSFKSKDIVTTSRALELLHLDLFGITRSSSLGGKRYGFVIVNDYSRFTWVLFLSNKTEALSQFKYLCNRLQMEKGYALKSIRSDHGREFEKLEF